MPERYQQKEPKHDYTNRAQNLLYAITLCAVIGAGVGLRSCEQSRQWLDSLSNQHASSNLNNSSENTPTPVTTYQQTLPIRK